MQKLLLFILVLFFINPNVSLACSCGPSPSFCESIIGTGGDLRPDIIIRGTYSRGDNQRKDIKVNQTIYGSTKQNKIILQDGFCDVYTNELENGDEYIFALQQSQGDYFLLACSVSFLKVTNGQVIGKIAPGVERLSYRDFLKFEDCGEDRLSRLISIFPNPTSSILRFQNISSERELKNLSINIFDVAGRKVVNPINEEGILPEEVMTVNVSDLSPGVYLVRIFDGISEHVERIVKL